MPKGSAPKIRKPYVTQACTICRARKSKCDGVKPVCGSCASFGRDDECSWGRHVAPRKPRTEAHFEALRKRECSLQAYVDLLEGILAKCICQDGSYLQFRPRFGDQDAREALGGDSSDTDVLDSDVLDSDEEITQELTVPAQRLKLDDLTGGLLLRDPYFGSMRMPPASNKVSRAPNVVENPTTVYVLQVDGVDISRSHPDIDWSRHLPPEVAIDRREHDKIIDLTFKFRSMFQVIPSLFLRDMYRALSVPRSEEHPTTPHYSPMLHNAILSVFAVFSDNPYLRDPKTRVHFVQAAKACSEVQEPDLNMVHAFALIGEFYADCGKKRISAELYFGMSTRLSMSLGLGVDATEWVKAGLITHDEMIGRNWAHWATFSLNLSWALYFGRDIGESHQRSTPMPLVQSEFDQSLWYHPGTKTPPQPCYLTRIVFEASALLVISHQIVDVLNSLPPLNRQDAIRIDENITRIDLALNNWKSRLPPQLDITLTNRDASTPQRLLLHFAYWWSTIALHRPFFNRRAQSIQNSDPEVDHVKLCTRAAENILELTETWSSLFTLRLSSLKIRGAIFAAGTVLLLRALQATASARIAHGVLHTSLAQVETCIRYLHLMGETWASAMRTGDMLQSLLNDRLRPVIARRVAQRGGPTPAAATSTHEETPAGSSPGTNVLPAEPEPEPTPLYPVEWGPHLTQDAVGWSLSEPPVELEIFEFESTQTQNPCFEASCTGLMNEAFPELNMNGFVYPTSNYWFTHDEPR